MTNLDLAHFINEELQTGYEVYLESEEEPECICIEYFVIEPGTHMVETIAGTKKCKGFVVSICDEYGESLVRTFGNIHGALSYVFTNLAVQEVRDKVHKVISMLPAVETTPPEVL